MNHCHFCGNNIPDEFDDCRGAGYACDGPKIKEGSTHNTREEQIDIAIANLIFSGLSIAQMDKIPKWLLENMENNKTKFKETYHQELQKARELPATPEQILVWLSHNGHQDIASALLTKLRSDQSELDQPTKCEHDVVAKYCFRCKRPDLAGIAPTNITS